MKKLNYFLSKLSTADQANLVRLSGDGNYTNLHIQGKRPQLYARSIGAFERVFTSFIRVHKKHLINPAFVRNLRVVGKEISCVVMMDGEELPVSPRRIAEVDDKLATAKID